MSSSRFPFSYGVNEFSTHPWSFEEDVENYSRLGVEAIEVCEAKLHPNFASEQLKMLAETDLSISSVQPKVWTMVPSFGQPQPSRPEERLKNFRQSIEKIAPYAPGAVFDTNTGPAPKSNMAEAIKQTIIDHQELASIADYHGVKIALEPLNPVSLNLETAIWTYGQALDIVQEIDRDNVGICIDLWNIWQDDQLIKNINAEPERNFLLQASDWRTPLSSADRRSVGTGEILIGKLLHAVYNAGYRGPCA
jgi:sugar phosphate isomerase/epimerase